MWLIDPNRLANKMDFIAKAHEMCQSEYEEGVADTWENAAECVREFNTIDAVPVVRCKDCKFATPKMGGIVCDRFGRTVKRKDDFCSYGETP